MYLAVLAEHLQRCTQALHHRDTLKHVANDTLTSMMHLLFRETALSFQENVLQFNPSMAQCAKRNACMCWCLQTAYF